MSPKWNGKPISSASRTTEPKKTCQAAYPRLQFGGQPANLQQSLIEVAISALQNEMATLHQTDKAQSLSSTANLKPNYTHRQMASRQFRSDSVQTSALKRSATPMRPPKVSLQVSPLGEEVPRPRSRSSGRQMPGSSASGLPQHDHQPGVAKTDT